MRTPLPNPIRPAASRGAWLAAAAALLVCAGCYNGQTLIDRARNHALRTRVEEVDLGEYSITMPRDIGAFGMTEVQVQPFGRTVRYKLSETEDAVEEHEYLVRHAVLTTIRSTPLEAFADPDLADLRERLLVAVQEALGNEAIDSIGFRRVRFIRH